MGIPGGSVVKNPPAIKENTFESVLMRWMKLEPIIQSEVSQKVSFNFMAAVTICSDFGAQKNKV